MTNNIKIRIIFGLLIGFSLLVSFRVIANQNTTDNPEIKNTRKCPENTNTELARLSLIQYLGKNYDLKKLKAVKENGTANLTSFGRVDQLKLTDLLPYGYPNSEIYAPIDAECKFYFLAGHYHAFLRVKGQLKEKIYISSSKSPKPFEKQKIYKGGSKFNFLPPQDYVDIEAVFAEFTIIAKFREDAAEKVVWIHSTSSAYDGIYFLDRYAGFNQDKVSEVVMKLHEVSKYRSVKFDLKTMKLTPISKWTQLH